MGTNSSFGDPSVKPRGIILLVEDDGIVAKWIHAQLEASGYNLLEAHDGAEALLIAELHRGRIDVVVTDVVMPALSGPELVSKLVKFRPDIRVIYMSGFSPSELRQTGALPQGLQYLQKPFAMTALLDRVRQSLESRPTGKETITLSCPR